jgi:23S rRNA pseudouridine955/2504/2580 synthase/23S rRNA pseudouridine1911/1915/1917 synthase
MKKKPCARVSANESGRRLVDWLSSRFTYLPADCWKRMIAEGRISVDDAPASPDLVLARGQTVAFDPPPYEEPEVDPSFSIIFESADFLVVDKSGKLPCHPSGRYYRNSLWYLLRERCGEVKIATRLDRETSGLVLTCKSGAAASRAEELLVSGSIEKEYLALVEGAFPERLDAEGFLERDRSSAVRIKRRYVEGPPPRAGEAESCSTRFELARHIEVPSIGGTPARFSLLRAWPRTGRTHQIRATLKSLGFPVVGDKLYGADESFFLRHLEGSLNEEDLARLMLPNQALHCSGLAFQIDGGEVRLRSLPRWAAPFAEAVVDLSY